MLTEQDVTSHHASACCDHLTVEELAQAIRALPLADRLKLFALVLGDQAK
jgi:hypothetical protein